MFQNVTHTSFPNIHTHTSAETSTPLPSSPSWNHPNQGTTPPSHPDPYIENSQYRNNPETQKPEREKRKAVREFTRFQRGGVSKVLAAGWGQREKKVGVILQCIYFAESVDLLYFCMFRISRIWNQRKNKPSLFFLSTCWWVGSSRYPSHMEEKSKWSVLRTRFCSGVFSGAGVYATWVFCGDTHPYFFMLPEL